MRNAFLDIAKIIGKPEEFHRHFQLGGEAYLVLAEETEAERLNQHFSSC